MADDAEIAACVTDDFEWRALPFDKKAAPSWLRFPHTARLVT